MTIRVHREGEKEIITGEEMEFTQNHPTLLLDAMGNMQCYMPERRRTTLSEEKKAIFDAFFLVHGWKTGKALSNAIRAEKLLKRTGMSRLEIRHQLGLRIKEQNKAWNGGVDVVFRLTPEQFKEQHDRNQAARERMRVNRKQRHDQMVQNGEIVSAEIFHFENEHLIQAAYDEHPYIEGERLDALVIATESNRVSIYNWFLRERADERKFIGDERLRAKRVIVEHPEDKKRVLVAFYQKDKYPSTEEYDELEAACAPMTRTQVIDWFKQRRRKERTKFNTIRRKMGLPLGPEVKITGEALRKVQRAYDQWPHCSRARETRLLNQVGVREFSRKELRDWWMLRLGRAKLNGFFVPAVENPHGHLRWKREAKARNTLFEWLERLENEAEPVWPERLTETESSFYFLPPHCTLNYKEWTADDVAKWIMMATNNDGLRAKVIERNYDGAQLHEEFIVQRYDWPRLSVGWGLYKNIRSQLIRLTNMANGNGGRRMF